MINSFSEWYSLCNLYDFFLPDRSPCPWTGRSLGALGRVLLGDLCSLLATGITGSADLGRTAIMTEESVNAEKKQLQLIHLRYTGLERRRIWHATPQTGWDESQSDWTAKWDAFNKVHSSFKVTQACNKGRCLVRRHKKELYDLRYISELNCSFRWMQ